MYVHDQGVHNEFLYNQKIKWIGTYNWITAYLQAADVGVEAMALLTRDVTSSHNFMESLSFAASY